MNLPANFLKKTTAKRAISFLIFSLLSASQLSHATTYTWDGTGTGSSLNAWDAKKLG